MNKRTLRVPGQTICWGKLPNQKGDIRMTTVQKFKVNVADATIDAIKDKVANYLWGAMPDLPIWDHGTNRAFLKDLCVYWVTANISCSPTS